MSWQAVEAVLEFSQTEGTARNVLLAIASDCDDCGVGGPGVERIAQRSKLTPRYTQMLIREIERLGEIEVTQRGGRHLPNLYRIKFVAPQLGLALSKPRSIDQGLAVEKPRSVGDETLIKPRSKRPETLIDRSPDPKIRKIEDPERARARGPRPVFSKPQNSDSEAEAVVKPRVTPPAPRFDAPPRDEHALRRARELRAAFEYCGGRGVNAVIALHQVRPNQPVDLVAVLRDLTGRELGIERIIGDRPRVADRSPP